MSIDAVIPQPADRAPGAQAATTPRDPGVRLVMRLDFTAKSLLACSRLLALLVWQGRLQVDRAVDAVACGDVTQRRVTAGRDGFHAALGQKFNQRIDRLRSTLAAVQAAAQALGSASAQVSHTAQCLAHPALQQAAGVEETTARLHEPSLHKTSDLKQETAAAPHEQHSSAGQITGAMNHLSGTTQQTAGASAALSAQARRLQQGMAGFRLADHRRVGSRSPGHGAPRALAPAA